MSYPPFPADPAEFEELQNLLEWADKFTPMFIQFVPTMPLGTLTNHGIFVRVDSNGYCYFEKTKRDGSIVPSWCGSKALHCVQLR